MTAACSTKHQVYILCRRWALSPSPDMVQRAARHDGSSGSSEDHQISTSLWISLPVDIFSCGSQFPTSIGITQPLSSQV